jgi:tetrapyrrole methylase family protein/MazG family protein
MVRLRGGEGCPWDREQTHQSLKPYVIEEAYEVWDAIDEDEPEKLCEELGDLLLQVVFHAQLAAETGAFTMNDVVESIVTKLIRRHPHVFADVKVRGVGDVLTNWEAIKQGEKGARGRSSALDGIPKHLPALLTAQKMQGKAARTGFEWPDQAAAVDKVWEEAREVRAAYARYRELSEAGGSGAPSDETKARGEAPASEPAARELAAARAHLEEEVGDLLFAVVNVARFLHVNAEVALRRTVVKFARRFRRMEETAAAEGQSVKDLDLDRLLALWAQAKRT